MVRVATEYISVGGNRHPGAADWDVRSGLLAFGADNNVALWDPSVGVSKQSFIAENSVQELIRFSHIEGFRHYSSATATK